ncbi:helix-turn-helix domain-containing protein [Radicibacter daui]|uniref:helix-turn-helix domain-containing protein n=1 Tax=Radicibacter daui TaxID=3064829 RepID=UPI004046BB12
MTMTDLINELEAARQARRISQAEVAGDLGISQGHYSKIVARNVTLTRKMSLRMSDWLGRHDGHASDPRLREVLSKCIDLMHSLELYLRG